MRTHIKILGVLYLLYGAKIAFGALCFLLILAGVTFVPTFFIGGPLFAFGTSVGVTIFGICLVVYSLVVAALDIVAGLGLLNEERWARILGIVLGVLNLIRFPLGTALGIYTLWVLLQEETTFLFSDNNRRFGMAQD